MINYTPGRWHFGKFSSDRSSVLGSLLCLLLNLGGCDRDASTVDKCEPIVASPVTTTPKTTNLAPMTVAPMTVAPTTVAMAAPQGLVKASTEPGPVHGASRRQDELETKRYVEKLLATKYGSKKVQALALAPGDFKPDCTTPLKDIEADIDKLLTKSGEIAGYFKNTPIVLEIMVGAMGTADGTRWLRENGPLCKKLKRQYEQMKSGRLVGPYPKSCNEFAAAVRGEDCYADAMKHLAPSIAGLSAAAGIEIEFQGIVSFITCGEQSNQCRGADLSIEIGFRRKSAVASEKQDRVLVKAASDRGTGR